MKADNWEKLENIFQAAIGLPLGERKPFLLRECAGDSHLQSEIESLIASFENDAEFLDEPVFDLGLGALHEQSQKNLSGQIIGAYEIKEKIGAGGMGEVYKAFDTKLNRTVALKFLSESLKTDASARRQLIREAQAAAALEHPNICAVYGFEQTEDHHFIVMQHIDGKTLDESFESKKIGVEEFKRIARQILDAVAFAHSHGVLHRDLKPGNIMLTNDGQIKILDFGLAKIDAPKEISGLNSKQDLSRYSQNGLIVGTVSYMSPEQLRGERLDFRSDIFSVGIIFYKLICGENPFNRPSQAETIAAILSENPGSFSFLKKRAPEISPFYLKIIEKCLQTQKDNRFQSVAEILVEINQAESKNPTKLRKGVFFFLRVFFFVIFIASAIGIFLFFNNQVSKRTLAVLPIAFESQQTEKEYLAGGLTQNIIDKLSNLSDLKVKNEYFISRYQGKNIELRTAGKELGADAVFYGTIRNRPEGLFLETKVIRTFDGALIDTFDWQVDEAKLVELQESISARILSKIDSKLSDKDKNIFSKKDTESNQAKDFYMQGRFYLKRRKDASDVQRAIEAFTNAKDLDQNYARAWAGLADAYLSKSAPGVKYAVTPHQAVEAARLAANRAFELDNNLCDTYNSLGLISFRYDWNWQQAEDYFRMALEHDPEFVPARLGLVNVLKMTQRYDEALEEAKKIKEYDPFSIAAELQIALINYRKGDYVQTDKILTDLLKRSPDDQRIKYVRVYQLLKTARFNEAVQILEPLYNSNSDEEKVYAAAPLGFAYAKMGQSEKAFKIINDLVKIEKKIYVPAQEKALIYVGLGNYDKVFEYMKLSCNEKFSSLPGWVNDPIVDEVKTDPRFSEIRHCANL